MGVGSEQELSALPGWLMLAVLIGLLGGGVYMRLFPPVEVVEDIVSVNGVGDTFLGVLVVGLAKGLELNEDRVREWTIA